MNSERPLGKSQWGVLQALVEHGFYSEGSCGWVWNYPALTDRICQSLQRRGLALIRVPTENDLRSAPRWEPSPAADALYKQRVEPQFRSGRGRRI